MRAPGGNGSETSRDLAPGNMVGDPVVVPATGRGFHLVLAAVEIFVSLVLGLGAIPHGNLNSFLLPALLGYMGYHFLRLALDPRPRFLMDESGVVDRTFVGGGDLTLPWEEITEVDITRIGGTLFIKVRDPSRLWRFAGWPRNLWLRMETLLGKKDLRVPILNTSHGPNRTELKERMEATIIAHERVRLGFPPAPPSLPGGSSPDPR